MENNYKSYIVVDKLKEEMVGVQVELAGGHQYQPGSIRNYLTLRTGPNGSTTIRRKNRRP